MVGDPDHAPFKGDLSSVCWDNVSKMEWFGVVLGHSGSLEIAPFDRVRLSPIRATGM